MTQASVSRYTGSIPLGAVITFGLLFLMQHLIASGENPFVDTTGIRILPISRVRPPTPPETTWVLPDDPLPPPVRPDTNLIDSNVVSPGIGIEITRPAVSGPEPIESGVGYQAGPALALVIVAPTYPTRAAQRGLDGYVIVEFTITSLGTVTDVLVTDSSDSIFNRAAVEAAYNFKYKPRVIDGQPVDSPGARYRFTFVLDD